MVIVTFFVKLFLWQSLFRNRRQKKTSGANSGENNEKPTADGDKKQKQKFHKIQRFEHNPQTVNARPLRVKP